MHTEPIELVVERIGAAGDGVARWRGEWVFLPFTAVGDRVRAVLGQRRSGGREARVVELLAAGGGRRDPPCRHFGRCGGCALQHLDAETYRAAKLAGLHRALDRVGLDPAVVRPLRVAPPGRRRARLGLARPAAPHRLPPRVGFRARFRHDLVDLDECPVLEPPLMALVPALRRLVPDLLPAVGKGEAGRGEAGRGEAGRGEAGGGEAGRGEALVTRTDSGLDLLVEARSDPTLAALEALATFAAEHDLARIVWRSRAGDMPVVERRPVRVMRSGVAVGFPPGAFLQASEAAEAILIGEVVAAIGGACPVLDLFAGLGGFAFALAANGPVHAVEGDEGTVAALVDAARGVPGVTVERRDLARDPLPPERLAGFAAAVFDPPRAGALRQAAALASSALAAVVAVSCNPATFARDAARLAAGGFRLERVVPVDQFVWTPHLELVAEFRR